VRAETLQTCRVFRDHSCDLVDFAEPFIGSHAVAEGVVTSRALRTPLFTRLFRNIYIYIASAAAVRGLELVGTYDPIEFVLPESLLFSCQAGVHIRRTVVRAALSREIAG
jgi:hypothetical protein